MQSETPEINHKSKYFYVVQKKRNALKALSTDKPMQSETPEINHKSQYFYVV